MNKEDYEKYSEMYDDHLKNTVETAYKDEYRKGWYISDIVKLKDEKWLIKWSKKVM